MISFQSDLSTIQSMGTKLSHNYSDKEDLRVNQEQSPRSPDTCHQESPRNSDNHPPASSQPSPKNTQEVTNNSTVDYQQQTDYNSVKKVLEYGSDSSSDTGVCSLSSTEGDYSLSTLVWSSIVSSSWSVGKFFICVMYSTKGCDNLERHQIIFI